MKRLIHGFLLIGMALAISACRMGDPGMMSLSMSAYTDRPVVLTEIAINGQSQDLTPRVITGRADVTRPRAHGTVMQLQYPPGTGGQMQLEASWVELANGMGYRAVAEVPRDALQRDSTGAVAFMPVFAPGGLLIVASDPVPQSPSDTQTRDVARVCGARMPDADRDFTRTPRELPGLFEALSGLQAGPVESECQR